MKPLATRRSALRRSAVDERDEKINRLPREIDVRRWKALKTYVKAQLSCGKKLDQAGIGRKKGHKNGDMVNHILNGHSAMNEIWMLFIADGYGVAPQVIWGEDWPFPQLTPDFRDPRLQRVTQRWSALEPLTRRKIIALARASR